MRNDTSSFGQVVTLTKNKIISFETDYRNGYNIEVKFKDTVFNNKESFEDFLSYELEINGDKEKHSGVFNFSNKFNNIGSFGADEGDKCSLTFTSVGSALIGKQVILVVDVAGGGPSIGNAFTRDIRPTIQKIFQISGPIFLLMFSLLLLTHFKKIRKIHIILLVFYLGLGCTNKPKEESFIVQVAFEPGFYNENRIDTVLFSKPWTNTYQIKDLKQYVGQVSILGAKKSLS